MSFLENIPPTLSELGFDTFFSSRLSSPDAIDRVARVAVEHRSRYVVVSPRGAEDAVLAGRLRHEAHQSTDLPRVGDWVELVRGHTLDGLAVIESVLPRRTLFARRAAGESKEPQVIAANVDVVLIVSSMSASDDARVQRRGINVRRLERYSTAVRRSGALPVFVINKCDLSSEHEALDEIREIAEDARVIMTSAVSGAGLDELRAEIGTGRTVALVGSSGVGKSALTNRLLGREVELVGAVRGDDERGRHTTTHRELFVLPGGGLLIDTPGMRELGLWWESGSDETGFEDIERLGRECRFRDCRHAGEPGCAVVDAIERGELDEERLSSQQKLERELAFERRKVDPLARSRAQRELKRRARDYRRRDKLRQS